MQIIVLLLILFTPRHHPRPVGPEPVRNHPLIVGVHAQ